MDTTDSKILQIRMLAEARIILQTVDFLEAKIDEKLIEFEAASEYHVDAVLERIKSEILDLNKKLTQEVKNMDAYMAKYSHIINNEKKTVLSYIREKKPTYIRGVSTNARRAATSEAL